MPKYLVYHTPVQNHNILVHVFIKSKEDSKTSLKDWVSLELEDIVTHCCIKNTMHNMCIYVIHCN